MYVYADAINQSCYCYSGSGRQTKKIGFPGATFVYKLESVLRCLLPYFRPFLVVQTAPAWTIFLRR